MRLGRRSSLSALAGFLFPALEELLYLLQGDTPMAHPGLLLGGKLGKIKSIGVLRPKVREMLKEELKEIDSLVQQILTA